MPAKVYFEGKRIKLLLCMIIILQSIVTVNASKALLLKRHIEDGSL